MSFVQDYVAVLEKYFPGRMEMMLFLRYFFLLLDKILGRISVVLLRFVPMGCDFSSGKLESGWEVIKTLFEVKISRWVQD